MVSKVEIVNLCEHFLNKDTSFPNTQNSSNFKHVIMRCGWREVCLKMLIKVLDLVLCNVEN